ncbi:ParB/RepB/Spo0J family partition protein [Oscillochloris sp. ZM17-4]|uniref:ParB/RepB/Spo0J family partition protein n=1 Tax=Oscillochloris sp. ZM17-4 TaxID=2866714 RepID=UPI001C7316B8|nr:ParB/RepB/Spo0J family partition protein [Oscillochloris sp. ZM17-4]MBX0328847.1 ParB/RepB/Spo0J family partition protein [Oscillochloris sp. ZM17-4]
MTGKPSDRLREMRERAAALKRRQPADAPLDADGDLLEHAEAPSAEVPLESHFGIAALDAVASGRSVQRVPVGHLAPETRPDLRQPRLMPRPEELLADGQPVPLYADLVATLLDLGRSLQQRQIQPIVAYHGISEAYPAARYLILVGHRRWTAAQLVGMPELDTIVIDPPSPADRVRLQYAENEDRADFTDMERAWALAQMKRALDDAPWETVEERFQMSRTRRQELLRLLAFSPEQQVRVAQLRLRETQVRPLHQALRDKELPAERVDALFGRMAEIASSAVASEGPSPQPAVDGPTVARLVAKAKRDHGLGAAPATAQWVQAVLDQLGRTRRSIKTARRRIVTASDVESAQLRVAIQDLALLLDEVRGELPEADGR